MIDKKSILNMASDVFKKGQGYPDRRLMHPDREWGIGLCMFAVVLAAGGFVAVQLYTKYSDVDALITQQPINVVSYNTQAANTALTIFRERDAAYQALTNSLPRQAPVTIVVASSTASTTPDQLDQESQDEPEAADPGQE